MKGNKVAVELTDFSVFYNQDSIAAAEAALAETKKRGEQDCGGAGADCEGDEGREGGR